MSDLDLKAFHGLEGELVLDTTEKQPSYLLIGKNGSHIKLSRSAYQLLRAGAAGVSFEELAQTANRNRPDVKVSKEQIESAYGRLVKQLNDIEDRAITRRLPFGFWLRFRLLPERLARKIGEALSFFYRPSISLGAMAVTAITFYMAFRHGFMLHSADSSIFPAYMLFLLSLIIHEFGHASACVRYGSSPSDIGFTIYLIYPAFYSDVSSAWQLTRWQRVIVDVGGNYFQLIVGCSFLWIYSLTHWEPLRLAVLMICYSAIFSLNPIFKFDGYWILADMLGVTNLAGQSSRIAKYFAARLFRKAVAPLPWPVSITSILVVYSTVSVLVWSMFIWKTLPMLWSRISQFADYVTLIIAELWSKQLPEWIELRTLTISLFFVIISATMTWRIFRQIFWPVLRRVVHFPQIISAHLARNRTTDAQ